MDIVLLLIILIFICITIYVLSETIPVIRGGRYLNRAGRMHSVAQFMLLSNHEPRMDASDDEWLNATVANLKDPYPWSMEEGLIGKAQTLTARHVSDATMDAWSLAHVNKSHWIAGADEVSTVDLNAMDPWTVFTAKGVNTFYDFDYNRRCIKGGDAKKPPLHPQSTMPFATISRQGARPRLFIEFIYRDMSGYSFPDFYDKIHHLTLDVFKAVSKQVYDIGVIRIRLSEPTINLKVKTISGLRCLRNEDVECQIIHIPSTQKQLLMDECIIYQSDDGYELIQIEHSEKQGSHKSNVFEFILRSINGVSTPMIKWLMNMDRVIINFPQGLSFKTWRTNNTLQYVSRFIERQLGLDQPHHLGRRYGNELLQRIHEPNHLALSGDVKFILTDDMRLDIDEDAPSINEDSVADE